jgi:hypothetical protein
MQLLQKILKNDTIVKEFIKPLLDILLDNGGLHGFDCVEPDFYYIFHRSLIQDKILNNLYLQWLV